MHEMEIVSKRQLLCPKKKKKKGKLYSYKNSLQLQERAAAERAGCHSVEVELSHTYHRHIFTPKVIFLHPPHFWRVHMVTFHFLLSVAVGSLILTATIKFNNKASQ